MNYAPDRKLIGTLLFSMTIVALAASLGVYAHALADVPKPSREDYQNLEDIKDNQQCLAETRPGYERATTAFKSNSHVNPEDIEDYNRFIDCKQWNVAEVEALNDNGWSVDWATMELVPTISPVSILPQANANQNVDLGKLADAVAMHETGYCKSQGSVTANSRNNCWGIMYWPNGVRTLQTFTTIEDGKQAFIDLWKRGYGGRLPTYKDAEVYSGNDKAAAWHANVLHFYNTL